MRYDIDQYVDIIALFGCESERSVNRVVDGRSLEVAPHGGYKTLLCEIVDTLAFGVAHLANEYDIVSPQLFEFARNRNLKCDIILDVRTQEEYDQGHIPDAIVISHEEIAEKAEEVLTDKEQLILVYCRSGRRSKIAAEALVELGYTNIKEFGGIIDWPYEVE